MKDPHNRDYPLYRRYLRLFEQFQFLLARDLTESQLVKHLTSIGYSDDEVNLALDLLLKLVADTPEEETIDSKMMDAAIDVLIANARQPKHVKQELIENE